MIQHITQHTTGRYKFAAPSLCNALNEGSYQKNNLSIARAIRRLSLSQVPVEALVNAMQEIVGGVTLTRCWHRPRCHATQECITRLELLPVLSVKWGPRWASAVEGYLHSQRHMLRKYQWPEWQRVWANWCEQDPRNLHWHRGSGSFTYQPIVILLKTWSYHLH